MCIRVVTIVEAHLFQQTGNRSLGEDKTENIIVDIVGVAARISDDEGLHEEHRVVVVNLLVTRQQGQYLDLTSANDHDASVGGGLDIHALDVVGETSTNALRIRMARENTTAILVIIAWVPRYSWPSKVSMEQSCYP